MWIVLAISLSVGKSEYYLFEEDYKYLVDFELGYGARLIGDLAATY